MTAMGHCMCARYQVPHVELVRDGGALNSTANKGWEDEDEFESYLLLRARLP